jgi:hypothetical protein
MIKVESAQGGRLNLVVRQTRVDGDVENVKQVIVDMSDYQLTELVAMLEKIVTDREQAAAHLRQRFNLAAKKGTP